MPPLTVPQAFAQAVQHHQAGRLGEAEALYRQILTAEPSHAEARHFLGVIAHQVGRHDLAVDLIRQALVLNPGNSAAHSNLGEAWRMTGRLDEAIASYRGALQLNPGDATAENNLGNALVDRGQIDEAVAAYRRALQLRPDFAEAHNNLGNALAARKQFDEGIGAYRRALALKPEYPDAHNNLGNALAQQGQYDEAMAAYRRALELRPDYVEAHVNLGNALTLQGQLHEAVAAYRQAIDLRPANAALLSTLIFLLLFCPGADERSIREEQARWNRLFLEPLRASWRPPANDPEPFRRLKIGCVSPDFGFHPVAFFLAPLLEAHDPAAFEIYCYASVRQPDAVTERLRKSADVWRDVLGLSDAQLAECVRHDGIDILVDLTMHAMDNRLPAFARKPAPVQVSWLAYPGTTGMETIDFRLTDAHIDPPDQEDDAWGGEAMQLPDSWCCYAPIEEFPTVSPLPAEQKRFVTFASLNQFSKLHEGVWRCWARLLGAVPGSRLLVVCPEGQARERTRAHFTTNGIAPERLDFIAPRPWAEYSRLFERIDVALDAYPCNGMTTTCHALWMGVPVVTLMGANAESRAGSSLLHTIGLPEWVARSEEEYIRIAAELASDLPRLAELRAVLRTRMEASPLMDAPRFARHFEAACRTMWQRWCLQNPSPNR